MSQQYEITVSAMGEVRDKDGHLISATPVEFEKQVITEEQAIAMGLIEKEK